jgi:hypothetical protein
MLGKVGVGQRKGKQHVQLSPLLLASFQIVLQKKVKIQ